MNEQPLVTTNYIWASPKKLLRSLIVALLAALLLNLRLFLGRYAQSGLRSGRSRWFFDVPIWQKPHAMCIEYLSIF